MKNSSALRAGVILGACGTAVPAAEPAVEVNADSFKCITQMTPVRHFHVDNLLGNIEGTLAVANSPAGGVYPPGSVVQLFPGEAMVKREAGFNPGTRDWEFFELDVSADGTQIRRRGFADVNNRFGGNCFACHIKAQPQWDMVCEADRGCDAIPVPRAMFGALQRNDPRCGTPESVTPGDAEFVRQWQELVRNAEAQAAAQQRYSRAVHRTGCAIGT